jgi:hypothetical protein
VILEIGIEVLDFEEEEEGTGSFVWCVLSRME